MNEGEAGWSDISSAFGLGLGIILENLLVISHLSYIRSHFWKLGPLGFEPRALFLNYCALA